MAFNINTFIGNALNFDGYRPNLFRVEMFMPKLFGWDNFSFKAKATSIPGSDIGVASVFFYGREVKLAGNREFGPWTVTVYMDENDFGGSGTRGIFESWLYYINEHIENKRTVGWNSADYAGYFGDGYVYPQSKDGQYDLALYNMISCYPIDVGPLQLDWGDDNRVAEFTVTFDYQWWNETFNSTTLG